MFCIFNSLYPYKIDLFWSIDSTTIWDRDINHLNHWFVFAFSSSSELSDSARVTDSVMKRVDSGFWASTRSSRDRFCGALHNLGVERECSVTAVGFRSPLSPLGSAPGESGSVDQETLHPSPPSGSIRWVLRKPHSAWHPSSGLLIVPSFFLCFKITWFLGSFRYIFPCRSLQLFVRSQHRLRLEFTFVSSRLVLDLVSGFPSFSPSVVFTPKKWCLEIFFRLFIYLVSPYSRIDL